MAEDAGDEFTRMAKSIGNDLWMLVKTLVEENRRREREAKAQMMAAAKEKRAEDMAAQIRKEEREFMKAENEKMRAEMRDMLKANGMEASDKNMTLAQDSLDKMRSNEETIGANEQRIGEIDNRLKEINDQLHPGEDSTKPRLDPEKVKELEGEAANLKAEKAGLKDANSKLEAENVMLKNGRGLEQLKQDESVRNSLAKQMDQLNAGIDRQKLHVDRCNNALSNIAKEQENILNSPNPDMAKWEKLQTSKQTWTKELETAQNGITKKEGQLNDLKQGKSLEQLEKAGKLETSIAQGKQQISGQDKIINGYKANQGALTQEHEKLAKKREELLKNGEKPDGEALQKVEREMKEIESQKKGIQEKIDGLEKQKNEMGQGVTKLEKELDGLGQGQQGPGQSVGNKGPSNSVGGEKSWRPGSVGDQLQKEGYKIGQGPKQGQSLAIGARR